MESIFPANMSLYDIILFSVMTIQVILTTFLVPLLLVSRYRGYFKTSEFDEYTLSSASRWLAAYKGVATFIAIICTYLVADALLAQQELFNWDNQAGLLVMFLMAYLPILVIAGLEKKVIMPSVKQAQPRRSASLQRTNWRDFISVNSLIILLVGQILFVATVIYYMANPFEGFGGGFNFLGIVFLDIVMGASIYISMYGKQLFSTNDPVKRVTTKKLAVKINLFAWILASYYLSVSLIMAGEDLRSYSLVLQSVYLQVIFVVTVLIFSNRRPKSHSI